MIFILSMLLTSFIGFLICHRVLANLALTEKLFISIFIGWGYFTSLIKMFSTNFPEVELSENVLFALIIISLIVFSIPTVIIDRRTIIHVINSFPALLKEVNLKRSPLTFYDLRSRYYLIIPVIFLALVLLNISITFFYEIVKIDPIFQWVQRGELIFLEQSVSGAFSHPFGYYPLHVPILYAWAYFFDFDYIRIFFLIALLGLAFITMENIYFYSKSRYASLVFTIMIIYAQLYYTHSTYAEGITNIYFFLAVLYGLRYLEQQNIAFILLASFFMTMYANTRSEGLLYWGLLLVFIILISVLSKKSNIKHVFYWFLPLCIFYYIPKLNFLQSGDGLNLIMHAKIVVKAFLVFMYNFGEIYINKPYSNWESSLFPLMYEYKSLMHEYHANKITAMILSFFAFWDSLFFDPEKTHFYNVMHMFIGLIKRSSIELYIVLLLILWKEIRSLDVIRKFFMLVVFPIICFIIISNFMQIYYFMSPGTLQAKVTNGPVRHGGMALICLIYFLSINDYTRKLFNKIETNRWLAYILNIPFLYLLFKQA